MKLRHNLSFVLPMANLLSVLGLAMVTSVSAVGMSVLPNRQSQVQQAMLADRPLVFERNQGQYADAGGFIARGAAYYLALSPTELRVTLQKKQPPVDLAPGPDRFGKSSEVLVEYRALRISLEGADPAALMTGEEATTSCANYFLGNDPAKWQTGVPAYQRVRVKSVYPGIDLLHYGNQQRLEYDFEIAPGADPRSIAMRFDGADKLSLDAASGDLLITLGAQTLRQPKPVMYQTVHGQRKAVSGGYVLSDGKTITFSVEGYDQRLPLVIDPVVSYSKLFGGPNDDTFWAIAVDANGSVYLAGETLTPGLATSGAFQTNLAGTYSTHGDVIVAKFNNQLGATNYITYLGGSAMENAYALAVDGAGSVFITGYTDSTNFPTRFAIQTNISGTVAPYPLPALDLFIAKIGPTGTNLVFSTLYGGSDDEWATGIALDASTNIYVVGQTFSTNFPTKNTGYTNLSGGKADGFVLKLDATGTNVIYSMYLGGSGGDFASDVVVNPSGNPLVTGYTGSTNFPVTTNALQAFLNHTTNVTYLDDAFFAELDPAVGALKYSTFLGGTNVDHAIRMTVDATGAAYIAGWTQSGDFPRTSTNFYTVVVSNAAYADVFVTKLNPNHTNLDYSITFGGSARDQAWGIAVDSAGRASVVGETLSLDFPTNGLAGTVMRGTNAGGTDAFIAQINATGSAFKYSAYLGSPAEDVGYGVAVDTAGNAYFVGRTASVSFPLLRDSNNYGAFSDRAGFIVKMLADELPALSITRNGTNANLTWSGLFPELTVQASTNLLATNAWFNLNASTVLTNSQSSVTLSATNAAEFFRLKQ